MTSVFSFGYQHDCTELTGLIFDDSPSMSGLTDGLFLNDNYERDYQVDMNRFSYQQRIPSAIKIYFPKPKGQLSMLSS